MPAGEAANNTHFIVFGLIRDGSKSPKLEGDEQTNHYATKVIQHQKGHQHTKDI